jgi:hypothetical protein
MRGHGFRRIKATLGFLVLGWPVSPSERALRGRGSGGVSALDSLGGKRRAESEERLRKDRRPRQRACRDTDITDTVHPQIPVVSGLFLSVARRL